MAKISSFKGWRYNSDKIKNLADVLVPPYDVISKEEQEEYYHLSPYNYIRVNLNKAVNDERYRLAANTLNMWIGSGIMIEEDMPAIYILSQSFKFQGRDIERIGFICGLDLSELGDTVLPHEQTIEKHLDDRFKLMEATSANTGQIFMCYKDKEMVLENIYSNIDGNPDIDVELDDVSYKLWAITDKQILNELINCLSDKSLVIADGHHRYKTALKYAKQNKNLMESQKVMVTLVNSNNPGMQIMPTHRLLSSINMDIKAIKERLNECFDVNEFLDLNTLLQELESSRNKNGMFGLYHKNSNIGLSLNFNAWDNLNSKMKNHSKSLRELDTNILHAFLLKDIFCIDTNKQKDLNYISYLRGNKSPYEMLKKEKDYDVVCFVNPPSLDDVFDIAEAGETMPQKSTYFFPKVYSGIVTRCLNK